MLDLYNTDKTLRGTFKGTTATLVIGTLDGALKGALVQGINMQYSRQVTRILELGSTDQYYVIGQSQGGGNINSIVGPNRIVTDMIQELADECEAASRQVSFQTVSDFCGDSDTRNNSSEMKAVAQGALLTQVSLGVTADNFLVQQGGQFMFVAMQLESAA